MHILNPDPILDEFKVSISARQNGVWRANAARSVCSCDEASRSRSPGTPGPQHTRTSTWPRSPGDRKVVLEVIGYEIRNPEGGWFDDANV